MTRWQSFSKSNRPIWRHEKASIPVEPWAQTPPLLFFRGPFLIRGAMVAGRLWRRSPTTSLSTSRIPQAVAFEGSWCRSHGFSRRFGIALAQPHSSRLACGSKSPKRWHFDRVDCWTHHQWLRALLLRRRICEGVDGLVARRAGIPLHCSLDVPHRCGAKIWKSVRPQRWSRIATRVASHIHGNDQLATCDEFASKALRVKKGMSVIAVLSAATPGRDARVPG